MKPLKIACLVFLFTNSNAQLWTKVNTGTSQGLLCLYFLDANNGWVVGNGGTEKGVILKTDDAALSFTKQSTGYFSDNKSISAADVNHAWIADGSIILRYTDDGGKTWTGQTPGPSPSFPYNLLQDVFFTDVKTGWTVGNNGTIYKTTNGGTSWSPQTSGTTENLTEVFFINNSTGWAAGANTTFLKTTDGGNKWTIVNLNLIPVLQGHALVDIFFKDASTGWAAIHSALLLTTDGGNSWTPANNFSPGITSIFFSDLMNGWAVGSFSGVYKSTDGGLSWTTQTGFGSTEFLNSVFFTDANTGWICGTGGTLWKYSNVSTISGPSQIKIKLFPNPTEGILTVEYPMMNGSTVIHIVNSQGQSLAYEEGVSKNTSFNIKHLPPGLYFTKVIADNRVIAVQKFVKQ